MRRLILKSFQSPGDVVMLTAAVRDLHAAAPGQFQTDVRTAAEALWEHNPHLTTLREGEPGVESVDMHYPLVHQSNQRPYHFLHGYAQYLEERLGLRVPVTRFAGDIHLSADEKSAVPLDGLALPERFWIIVAGGKHDFTAKWWNPESYQRVVDHFAGDESEKSNEEPLTPDPSPRKAGVRGEQTQAGSLCHGKIQFVQCGEAGHWHPRLKGVIDLVGKTTLREFVRLMYHAEGVVCPVTFAMHLAAAVETRPGRGRHRPCVVIAGGREPTQWEAYPNHQYLSTVGMLSCCADGGCWKSRCQLVGDGDPKDRRDVCEQPVQITPELRIPKCLDMISSDDVIRKIEMYLSGGLIRVNGVVNGDGLMQTTATTNGHVNAGAAEKPPHPNPLPRRRGRGDKADGEDVPSAERRDYSKTPHPGPLPTTAAAVPEPGRGDQAETITKTRNVLLTFRHGLGDAVQFTVVLKHLQQLRPEWNVDVATLLGKHSAFSGLCRKVYVIDRQSPPCCEYHERHVLDWHECPSSLADAPSTKPSRCLEEVFQLAPVSDLCRYAIQVSPDADQRARRYLASICPQGPNEPGRYPAVLIHYEGNTSGERKNLSHELVRDVCEVILRAGHVPVILDWDRRSPLPDGVRIHCPGASHELWHGHGTGDAESLAALIDASALLIGVDSGPLHVAGATTTPTFGVWTKHHPVHFFDRAENILHLVPSEHETLINGPEARDYFHQNYRHHT